ncbi:hypothetical protein GCM10009583_04380 [Ornithinicoccus hortensis]
MVTAAAGTALVAAALAPVGATADEVDRDDLGTASDYGVTAPEASAKFQDGQLSGADQVPSAYFIQLRGTPTATGGSAYLSTLQRSSFLSQAAEAGADLTVRQTFDTLWTGLSVDADEADVRLAAQSDAVVAVYPVYRTDRPELAPQDDPRFGPQMASALAMTGADKAHEMGYTGEGMRVGIIDTGVDVDHPDFGGGGTPTDGVHDDWQTPQLQFGYDLVGDAYNSNPDDPAYDPVPVPDGNPDDCQGHGTHVAGIAAGNGDPDEGGIIGVAPDAELGAYRVFGCEGSTEADIMLAAMELTYQDGMDVVNMSIGSSFMSWPQYPTAVSADTLSDAGVVVVASIGNEGDTGTWSAGAPGVGEKTIGVASYDNTQVSAPSFTYGPEETGVPYFVAAGSPAAPTEGTQTVARLGDPGTADAQACTADGGITEDLTGKVVLIERGVCAFYEKAFNAEEAGAIGVVLYNNVPGMINPTVEGDPAITVPVVMIFQQDGHDLDASIVEGDADITWTTQTSSQPNPTGGMISEFSSYGMTADLTLKPDLGAPGGSIYSTIPLEKGGHGNNSGTSMSSPHAAGAAALLLQAHPDLAPQQVRDTLQNSADPAMWSLNPAAGLLEGAHRQGAGLIDVDDAILATAAISPGKLSLGEGTEAITQTVEVSNDGESDVTYTIANNAETVATGAPTTDPGYFYAPATLEAPESVTVPAGETVSVELTLTPPDQDGLQYTGYVEFTAEDDSVLRVPYAGYSGDYQEIEVLTPGAIEGVEFPVLGQLVDCAVLEGSECIGGGTYDIFPDTGEGDEPVYDLAEGNIPVFLANLGHQSRSMTLTAYEANADGSQGEEVGVVEVEDYLPRSASPTGFSTFTWDGTFEGGTVPDGKYVLEATVLKALGEPGNEAHQETWTSEPFTIADASADPTSPTVTRYTGYDRYATAARISAEYEPGVDTVYIATGRTFPDALTGAAKAALDGVPVLLTRPDELPAATLFELDRLKPADIVVLGGTAAIEDDVLTELEDYTDGTVSRLSGADRYATAAAISGEYAPGVDTLYVATGRNFPDALAGAARAGVLEGPVLLVRTDEVPEATAAELERLAPQEIVVLGGTAAVSQGVADTLGDYADVVDRIGGKNRYATAADLSSAYEPGTEVAFVATGLDYPDALAGAARAGHLGSPVLLVRPDEIPAETLAELERLEAPQVVVLGGTGAVSDEVLGQIEDLVYGD